MKTAYIALGSNIEPRRSYLEKAVHELQKHPQVKVPAVSSIYETEPVGYEEQAQFLNMAAEIETELQPLELLDLCQKIEVDLGRERIIRWGPRTVDLDILFCSNENMITERLVLPHPRMHERAFVLVPLAELNPDLLINSKRVSALLENLPDRDVSGVVKWGTLS